MYVYIKKKKAEYKHSYRAYRKSVALHTNKWNYNRKDRHFQIDQTSGKYIRYTSTYVKLHTTETKNRTHKRQIKNILKVNKLQVATVKLHKQMYGRTDRQLLKDLSFKTPCIVVYSSHNHICWMWVMCGSSSSVKTTTK